MINQASILDQPVVQSFVRTCMNGFALGFHERNGGNLSYRLTPEEVASVTPFLSDSAEWVPLDVTAKNLANEFFMVTGSGKYMQNTALATEETICILQLSNEGNAYRVLWGLSGGGKPTSELPTHILNHSVRCTATGGNRRVIYHAHPPALIALTYILPLTDRDFSRVLWKSMTECPIIFPDGVGVVKWMVPGGADIAHATAGLMEHYDAVVWAHHGLFCAGEDLDSAFGLMHTIEKSADIYLRACSTGQKFLQSISDDALRQVAKEFKVRINEKFLD